MCDTNMEMESHLSSTVPCGIVDEATAATEAVSEKKERPLRLDFGNGPRIHRQLSIEYGVVDKRCPSCGRVGQLTCFASSFRKWALRRVTEEELNQICSRCKERGHNCLSCDLPIIHRLSEVLIPMERTGRPKRCRFCGEVGHNRRTCLRAV